MPETEGAERIIAVGASAGGLAPIERLFETLPSDTGCAFVVVQHLSPDFRSMMDELLSRHTSMRIRRLEDAMVLEPDCIHLNLPRSLATLDGYRVRLEAVSDTTLVHHPIDTLFASLAEQHGACALGIVLSGTGSDGKEGAERLREHGGIVVAQSPSDARFDSMPLAVIEAGIAHVVAPAAKLGEHVCRWIDGEPFDENASPPTAAPSNDPLEDILALLQARYGTDFQNYKRSTVERRLQRRADFRGPLDLERYRDLLDRDADELDELYGDLLIEVTSFFRDAKAFERLETDVMPALIERLRQGWPLRLWVAGCASGEEAYSLAILLAEHAAEADVPLEAKILATDIHHRSLERATVGRYPFSSVTHLDESRIEAHFEREGESGVRVRESLRRMLLFSTHDVVRDAPFTRLDLLSCRNLLIYLNLDTQRRVMANFHFGLNAGGWLFLGSSENIADLEHEFEVFDHKWRLYRKRPGVESAGERAAIAPRHAPASRREPARGSLSPRPTTADGSLAFRRAHARALEQVVATHAPPGFLLTEEGDIVHIFGDAGTLLPMYQGVFSRRITELIRLEFRSTLLAALQATADPDFHRFVRRVHVREDTGRGEESGAERIRYYDAALERVDIGADEPGFLLLTLAPAAPSAEASRRHGGADAGTATDEASGIDDTVADDDAGADAGIGDTALLLQRVEDLEQDLRVSEQRLQTTIEELETTNEELQSANEELTSSNEELQSTNEELRSVNEELYTISAEHQRKIEELSELTTDVDHLLSAAEIGTIFLDRELRVRRSSDRADQLFGLGSQDLGRRIENVRDPLPEEITALPRRVLETHAPLETDIELDGRRHLLRLLPYIDDDEFDGVLLTSVDITELTETRRELGRVDREYRNIVEDTSSFIIRWRADDGRVTYCNAVYADLFDATPEALLGSEIAELIPAPERAAFFEKVGAIAPNESRFLAIVREEPDGGATYTVGFTRAIADAEGRIVEYQSTGQDMSEEYAYRRSLERLVETTKNPALEHEERLQRILDLCLDYLDLQSAFVGRIEGESYHVVAVAGSAAAHHRPGEVLALDETVCAGLSEESDLLAIDHLAESPLSDHPCRAATGIESVIAARLMSAEGRYGSISFSSPEPRGRPFTVAEEGFVLLVNGWIGHLIDSRRRLDRIAESNDYYQSLYLGLPLVMCLTDADGRIAEISDEWLEHLGCTREATVGTRFVDALRESDREQALEAIGQGSADDLPLCVRRADGNLVEHEMSCRTRSIGTLADMRLIVLTDISARSRAMAELESRNRELADANENLNQFAFVASHDLQEPLRKIHQFSGFLVEDDRDALSEDGRYHLKVIVEAAERMSTLIRDLLRYSRTSRNALNRERVALDDVLRQVRADLELPLADCFASLRVESLPRVSGDPVLLLQLFTNLVSNSLKYREPSRPLVVEVRHEHTAEGSRIIVEDNGIGFDPAYAKRVFEPFTRLHGSKEHQGSGIGLAICATVCRKHGWRIEADAAQDRGAVFTVSIEKGPDRPETDDARSDGSGSSRSPDTKSLDDEKRAPA